MRQNNLMILALCTILFSGCLATRPAWETASFVSPIELAAISLTETDADLAAAEKAYAEGIRLEKIGDKQCVDAYLTSAKLAWPEFSRQCHLHDHDDQRVARLYRSSVGKLIESAQQFGRLDPAKGIRTVQSSGMEGEDQWLPIRYHGFSWRPQDFRNFQTVGDYQPPETIKPKRRDGLGIPLLGQLQSNRSFVIEEANFAATAMLRQPEPDGSSKSDESSFVLDVINPLTYRDTVVLGKTHPIAYDLTAPLVYLSATADKTWLTGFLEPYKEETNTGLHMLEPYQPGKIPLIFVHGLASSPLTWAAMGNELFQHLDLLQNYQFWIFKYPTGKPFVGEAANLREQLVQLRDHIDPQRQDPALDQIVLIGHSMGGLVSKLQITTSADDLANSIFNSSIDELDITPEMRALAERSLFFEPSDQIGRVIFVGTPHRGSKIASSPIGSLASRLVNQSGNMPENFSKFVKHNQSNISSNWRKMPTSVDLLKPGNPTLEAIYNLSVSPGISMHSIIGTGHKGPFVTEPGDGVVPLSSARHRDVESELLVNAHHDLHHNSETIEEVARILRAHLKKQGRVQQRIADSSRFLIDDASAIQEPVKDRTAATFTFSD